jgi:hypothetical protein
MFISDDKERKAWVVCSERSFCVMNRWSLVVLNNNGIGDGRNAARGRRAGQ